MLLKKACQRVFHADYGLVLYLSIFGSGLPCLAGYTASIIAIYRNTTELLLSTRGLRVEHDR